MTKFFQMTLLHKPGTVTDPSHISNEKIFRPTQTLCQTNTFFQRESIIRILKVWMRITFFYKKESFESLKENFFRLTLDFHDSQQQAAAVGEMVFFSQPLDLVVSFLRKYVQYSTVFFQTNRHVCRPISKIGEQHRVHRASVTTSKLGMVCSKCLLTMRSEISNTQFSI